MSIISHRSRRKKQAEIELLIEILPTDWYGEKYHTQESWFPIAERVVTRLVGDDLVAVQPMAAPLGQLFHLDYQYVGGMDVANPANTDVQVMKVWENWNIT